MIKYFIDLADYLDKKGFFDAANAIDEIIEKISSPDESRVQARKIRAKYAGKKPFDLPYLFTRHEKRKEEKEPFISEPYPAYEEEKEDEISGSEYDLLDLFEEDQDVRDIMASLGFEKQAQPNLQGLTEEQKRRVQAIRNPGLANQWANHFRLQNVRRRQQQQRQQQQQQRQQQPQQSRQPQQPRQPRQPQQPQQPQQPRQQRQQRPSTSLRDPAKFKEYMRRMYGVPKAPTQSQGLTEKDFPKQLTRKDFPQEITEEELMRPEARRAPSYKPKVPEGF